MADPSCCTESGHSDLSVGGLLQQTDAAGMRSVIRELGPTLDGSVCLQAAGRQAGGFTTSGCWIQLFISCWMVSQRFLLNLYHVEATRLI